MKISFYDENLSIIPLNQPTYKIPYKNAEAEVNCTHNEKD